ncbi:HNH endonuclease [Ruminococcus sp.]|uniref:HNH endonuclease n=1 Tax=Ruminococcus sp. TaxID=41978 RepID=UPI0025F5D787|nr:HNH endonuclease [Ruminococcus sp.]
MSRIEMYCDFCGVEIYRYPSQIKRHNFCSRKCLGDFSSKLKNPEKYDELKDLSGASENMKRINGRLNKHRMTLSVRLKIRNAHLNSGESKAYAKYLGEAEHRVVAEKIMGRKLEKGEVVHHVDGNKRNNSPENLMVFSSQREHAKWHADHDAKGGMPS